MTKLCRRCGKEKDIATGFYRRPDRAGAPASICRKCKLAYCKKWKENNPDKVAHHSRGTPESKKIAHGRSRRLHPEVFRKRISSWRDKNPGSMAAHTAVYRAVKSGALIKPSRCEQCGSERRLHAHHHDYSKPLEVTWLCVPCHSSTMNRPQRKRGTAA